MTQFQVNFNNATMGHKLQGISKDALIISSFPNKDLRALFKNWECVVFYRVRKLAGLYLFQPIDIMESCTSFGVSGSYISHFRAIRYVTRHSTKTVQNNSILP